MFGENAAFLKSVEIDDSIFQCEPDCSKKYLLQLEWSRDNEAWQWKVLDSEDVLTSNDASDHEAITNLVTAWTDAPSTTPASVWLFFVDTSAWKLYVSTGTSSDADWTAVN